jgi:hypothetical protein
MPQVVEISLRVPSLRMQREGKDVLETISNADARFIKKVEVESIPKTGMVLAMEAGSTISFECEVVRSDWHESKNIFVIACQYKKRSITPADYQKLLDAPDWELRPLI